MHRSLIRLAGVLITLAIFSQLLLPPFMESRVAGRLEKNGGKATVDLDAIPAARLLLGRGDRLNVRAKGLSFDLTEGRDVFRELDKFGDVTVFVESSRAGPFAVRGFFLNRRREHEYLLTLQADAAPADVARYAGEQLAGGFGRALAGLAAATLGNAGRPIPVNSRMVIDTSGPAPRAVTAQGDVGGLPAGPLAQVVANTLLRSL